MSGQYRVILADPPWPYQRGGRGAARNHYQAMPLEAMKLLPVRAMADRNSVLLMWATYLKLPLAFELMAAWGFEYKTMAFTWVKLNKNGTPFRGVGCYTRANAEVCLLGTHGRVKVKAHNVGQALITPRREHSRKPDVQYDRIARLFEGPYLELFARQQWPGWDVWGNQTNLFPAQPFLFGEVSA